MRHFRYVCLLVSALSLISLAVAPVAAQEDRRLLFEEIFGGNYSGWQIAGSTGKLEVTANAVTITVNEPEIAIWATPALSVPSDVEIEVEARLPNPDRSGNWNLAVLLRASGRDLRGSFYHFGVAGSGSWEFSVRPPNASTYANSIARGRLSDFNPSRPIQLRVLASGNTFTFYVNNRLVRQFTDDTLPVTAERETYFGLMAGTYEDVSAHTVEFRKIAVYEVVRQRAFFHDVFPDSNPNDWGVGRSDNSDVRVEDNSLVFDVLKENVLSWSQPGRRFPQDVDVSVEVINDLPNPSRDWSYGLGVRAYREANDTLFYLFEVRGTGEFTFTAQRGGNVISTLIDVTRIPNFNPAALHKLRVRAVGEVFTLFVDGRQVGSVRATDLKAQPDYGILLTAGTFTAQTARARFTNFRVEAPR
jgi:hypothetical protein